MNDLTEIYQEKYFFLETGQKKLRFEELDVLTLNRIMDRMFNLGYLAGRLEERNNHEFIKTLREELNNVK